MSTRGRRLSAILHADLTGFTRLMEGENRQNYDADDIVHWRAVYKDLIRFKEQELDQLNHYGWIDKEAGIARIPIDRAMDILARQGLPEPAGPPESDTGSTSRSEPKKAAPPDTDPRTEKKSRP